MADKRLQVKSKWAIYGIFVTGLLSALSLRILIFFQRFQMPEWVRVCWYVGVIGYFIFFFYRYRIAEKRKKIVSDYQLIEKVNAAPNLTDEEKRAASYIFGSLTQTLENLNYYIIFVLSGVAIVLDVVFTLMK